MSNSTLQTNETITKDLIINKANEIIIKSNEDIKLIESELDSTLKIYIEKLSEYDSRLKQTSRGLQELSDSWTNAGNDYFSFSDDPEVNSLRDNYRSYNRIKGYK